MDFFIISQYHFGRLVLPGTTCQSARTFFRGALVLIALVATCVIEGLRKRFELFRRSRFRSLAFQLPSFPDGTDLQTTSRSPVGEWFSLRNLCLSVSICGFRSLRPPV